MSNAEPALSIVQYQLWCHTDRNPTDAAAVVDMMQEAVSTLGDTAGEFTDSLIKSLDPHTPGGLGVRNVERLEAVGSILDDPEASRVQKWGALSLLGALAMTHDPEIHRAAGAGELGTNLALYRSQLSGSLARDILTRTLQHTGSEPQEQRLIQAFLAHPPIPSEELAIEFELAGLRPEATPVDSTDPEDEIETDEVELLSLGARMGEPEDVQLLKVNSRVQKQFTKMDWLDSSFDTDTLDLVGRYVYHDGKRTALLVDLTTGNTTLRKLKEELEADARAGQFWEQLAASITHCVQTHKAPRVEQGKVTTFYLANKAGSSDDIVRAYFTPLGNGSAGDTPIFGLIAAFRTKGPQGKVLKLISNLGTTISER